jgi:hypothetical protein
LCGWLWWEKDTSPSVSPDDFALFHEQMTST